MLSAVRAGTPFAAALDAAIAPLADRDRRLAHEIAAGVLRARRRLDGRLRPLVTGEWRRVDPTLRDVLRIGAYQLAFLERVPAYAAVETAVDLARRSTGAGGAGLVNAVLRRLAAAPPPAAELGAPSTPGALGTIHSHPEWLVERWLARFGAEKTEALLAHNNRRPPLVIQPARQSSAELAGALAERGIAFEAAPRGLGLVVGRRRVSTLPGYHSGGFVVQDPGQAAVLRFAAFPNGSVLWDACAAPGGKALLLGQQSRVLASDANVERVRRLSAGARRVAPGTRVFAADARRPPFPPATLDGVLLDAPCSATGTIARHPDARWRLTLRRIQALAHLQAELLASVAPTVRPSGLLVYATCSLEPEENEQQVNRFLSRNAEFRRTTPDLFVFPADWGTDGAYAARLERTA